MAVDAGPVLQAAGLELVREGRREARQLAGEARLVEVCQAHLSERARQRPGEARACRDAGVAAQLLVRGQACQQPRGEGLRRERPDRREALLDQRRSRERGGQPRQGGAMPAERSALRQRGSAQQVGGRLGARRHHQQLFAGTAAGQPLPGLADTPLRRCAAEEDGGHRQIVPGRGARVGGVIVSLPPGG